MQYKRRWLGTYKTKYPILIPSKGRYDPKQARTISFLKEQRIIHMVVVEPSELEQYSKLTDWVETYPPTGVGKARQRTLELAKNMKAEAFWGLDDDVTGFRKNGKLVDPMEVFEYFERRMDNEPDIGIIGPQYSQILWRQKELELVNAQCPCIVTLSRTNVPFGYNTELTIGEDLDWMFKFVINGYKAVVDNRYTFDAQKSHRFDNKVGGIEYTDEELDSSLEILKKEYPGIVTKTGTKFRRNWRKLQEMAGESNVRS